MGNGLDSLSLQRRNPLRHRRGALRRPVVGLRHGTLGIQAVRNLPDGRRIFDGRDELRAAASGLAGLHVNTDQSAWSELEQPKAGPKGEGQDVRSKTRFRRWAHVIVVARRKLTTSAQ